MANEKIKSKEVIPAKPKDKLDAGNFTDNKEWAEAKKQN